SGRSAARRAPGRSGTGCRAGGPAGRAPPPAPAVPGSVRHQSFHSRTHQRPAQVASFRAAAPGAERVRSRRNPASVVAGRTRAPEQPRQSRLAVELADAPKAPHYLALVRTIESRLTAKGGDRLPYYGWLLAGGLGVTEIISWGVLYYAFSVFLTPMED